MRKRTRARELALQVLFQVDLRGVSADALEDDIDDMLRESGKPDDVCHFARVLATGTLARLEATDELIAEAAEHWDIRRMAAIDRNVLRMAVYEMTDRDDIPRKVSINEGIDLAKKFSTEHSGTFVNGILDRIRRTLEERDAQETA